MANHLIDVPASRLVGCVFCAERLDSNGNTTFQRAKGWVPAKRKSLVLPELLHVFACDVCIEKLKHGMSVGQMSLFTLKDDD